MSPLSTIVAFERFLQVSGRLEFNAIWHHWERYQGFTGTAYFTCNQRQREYYVSGKMIAKVIGGGGFACRGWRVSRSHARWKRARKLYVQLEWRRTEFVEVQELGVSFRIAESTNGME